MLFTPCHVPAQLPAFEVRHVAHAIEREPEAYVHVSGEVEVGNVIAHPPAPEPISNVPEDVEDAKEIVPVVVIGLLGEH